MESTRVEEVTVTSITKSVKPFGYASFNLRAVAKLCYCLVLHIGEKQDVEILGNIVGRESR